MRKILLPGVLLAAVGMVSCSGRDTIPQGQLPNAAGPWEFLATSNVNPGQTTGVEVALQAGQTLVNGVEQPNGQVSASGQTQIAIVSISPSGTVTFGGNCTLSGSGVYDLSGSFNAIGGPFNLTYTENGNVFNISGTIAADGKSMLGTYASASGSGCSDSGTITGTAVSKLSGKYTGKMTLPDGTQDTVTATLSESGTTLSVNLVATSSSFTLSGPVTGNAFVAEGLFQGNQVSYYGYLGNVSNAGKGTTLGIYFVSATSSPVTYAGTLVPTA